MKKTEKITTSQVSDYFSKNLGQVGMLPGKCILTSVREFLDNSLDSAEEIGVLPSVYVEVEKLGPGITKNTDKIRIKVEDNAAGIEEKSIGSAFGQLLASSRYSRGLVTRGRQGIGSSIVLVYSQLTQARGAHVISKTLKDKKALECDIEVDIKNNQGLIKNAKRISWDRPHGTSIEVVMDGKIQINGEAGLLTYLIGTCLVNPHLKLTYKLPDQEPVVIERTSTDIPKIPPAVDPHPHTLKLGEFISRGHTFSDFKVKDWLMTTFSRVPDSVIKILSKNKEIKPLLTKPVKSLGEKEYKNLYTEIQNISLQAPSTKSLISIGEENLSKSVKILGEVDFFSVVSRPPTICDFKPVQIEIAIARLKNGESDRMVQVLRFANRVPLQFDKANDVSVHAIQSVNWRSYGLNQPKDSLPTGPYIFAISVVSPFIKFKNASKETIDASDELMQEIRLALIQAGQKLSKFVKKEAKEADLEAKRQYIEKFAPILLDTVFRISGEKVSKRKKAEQGLKKILGRETDAVEKEIEIAKEKIKKIKGNK